MFEFKKITNLTDGEIKLSIEEMVPGNLEKGFVPAYKFGIFLESSNNKVGFIDIRIGYNDGLYYGGHIGYTVYESHRGNNYAMKACSLIKNVAVNHGMHKLIITCSPDNIASRKTCEKLGLPLIEIVDLPKDNDMYLDGARKKCIYEWKL